MLFRSTVDAYVVLDDVAGLSTGAVVSIAGVQVGRVEALKVEFDKARVDVSIDPKAEVRTDAIVVLRARSLLGEKYLEIVPQSHDAPLLADGQALTHTQGQLDIDQFVTRLGPLLDAIDPATLRQVGVSLDKALAEDPDRPARMLADTERALHNLAEASDGLPDLLGEAKDTLGSVKRTSDAARPVIARADGTVQRLDALVAAVPPDQLPALLDELQGAVKDGRAVITKMDGSTGDLSDLLHKANAITKEDIEHWAREEGVLIRLKPKKK